MPAWRLRDYHEADLDQAIQVWDQGRGPGSAEPVFSVAEVMAAARAGPPAGGCDRAPPRGFWVAAWPAVFVFGLLLLLLLPLFG